MLDAEGRIPESQIVEGAWPKVLDEHVRASQQSLERVASCRDFQVQRDALFVAIDAQEIGALAPGKRRSPGAGFVSTAGLLDLDTRAPMSASSMVQNGPDRTRVKSRIVRPASGPTGVVTLASKSLP